MKNSLAHSSSIEKEIREMEKRLKNTKRNQCADLGHKWVTQWHSDAYSGSYPMGDECSRCNAWKKFDLVKGYRPIQFR